MIGIILVNYKTNKESINFVKSELSKIKISAKIVIVNNDFGFGDAELYLKELSAILVQPDESLINKEANIFLINSRINLGFAKGNNLGAGFLLKNYKFDYLLFTNNDIIIETENIVEQLIEKLDSLPDVAIIGPKIVNDLNVKISPRFDRISAYRFIFRHLFFPINKFKIFSRLRIKTSGIKEIEDRNTEESYCYWVVGSFMLMKAKDFIAIKGFDPNTFLYCEEKILSERLRMNGKNVFYYGKPIITSIGGLTTSKYLTNKKRDSILFKSEIYYYKKYRNISFITLRLLNLSYWIYFNIYYRKIK